LLLKLQRNWSQGGYDRIATEKTAQGLTLVAVSNITEGNFLGFKEPDEIKEPVQTGIETDMAELKTKVDEILQILQAVK
jgi:hypothetical protein